MEKVFHIKKIVCIKLNKNYYNIKKIKKYFKLWKTKFEKCGKKDKLSTIYIKKKWI